MNDIRNTNGNMIYTSLPFPTNKTGDAEQDAKMEESIKKYIEAMTPTIDMDIVKFPEASLRQKCEEVLDINKEIVKFCNDLHLFCKIRNAYGLAAPQVGFNKRIIVINEKIIGTTEKKPNILINPVLVNCSGSSKYREGCLSLPGVFGQVERYNTFDVQYKDRNGKNCVFHMEDVSKDIVGTVIQHEIDHLDGKLFIDLLSPFEYGELAKKINKLRKKEMRITLPYAIMYLIMIVFDLVLVLGGVYLIDQRGWNPWWFLGIFLVIGEFASMFRTISKEKDNG